MISQFGMVGLGTMGANLVLNMSDRGFKIAGYDRNADQVDKLLAADKNNNVFATTDINSFISSLQIPRIIFMLVPAGKIVNAVIEDLKPHLSPGDIIADLGNSHFVDTNHRIKSLENTGLHFMGIGISGGETGARMGASIMPGGDKQAYASVKNVLEAVSAKYNEDPCVAYMGNGSAGHYVKMVHNGIEYGLMQLLAEAYSVLKSAGFDNDALHDIFSSWNKGRLQSFLVEITAEVFLQKDDLTSNRLIDMILDTAHQKGTGAWMSQDAMSVGAPIPAIDAAVSARSISSMKKERVAFSEMFPPPMKNFSSADRSTLSTLVERAVYSGFILIYAQGLAMLKFASNVHQFGTDMPTVARIWRAGCIIRAGMLKYIAEAYEKDPELVNMIAAPYFMSEVSGNIDALRELVSECALSALPVPVMSAALTYFDGLRADRLPANLLQAQRDFFGAHTYERSDREGVFHTEWNATVK